MSSPPDGGIKVRLAQPGETGAVSALIGRALREVNARDYPASVILRMTAYFGPERIAALMTERRLYVALVAGEVVGTASLARREAHTVFVRPDMHGRGVGRALMDRVEGLARRRGVAALVVNASITAEGFYRRRGYVKLRDQVHGEERTLVMEKTLTGRRQRTA